MTGVRCHHCQRTLCQRCDHRVKGHPYCQECIVAGIESIRYLRSQAAAQYQQAAPTHHKSPLVATLFALVPGLGAAYNGQHVKALCHFVLPVSLWQLASLLSDFPTFAFIMGGGALYLFSLFDAWQTAQRARAGADLAAEDARIKHWLQNNLYAWGAYLLGIGALTALYNIAPRFVNRAWPLLFLVAVAYCLRGLLKASSYDAQPETPYQPRPVSFMSTGMSTGMTTGLPSTYEQSKEPTATNLINAEHRFDRWG